MVNDKWLEIRPIRRQWPLVGKSMQGNQKDTNADTMDKDNKGREQGIQKEGTLLKSQVASKTMKGQKELKQSSWDKQLAIPGSITGQSEIPMLLQPPLHNIIWQVGN